MNECELQINRIIHNLTAEKEEKETEVKNIKTEIKNIKKVYNSKIREYNSLMRLILNKEKEEDGIEKQASKIKKRQNAILNMINRDLVSHLNDFINRIHPEIVQCLIEFFGFNETPLRMMKRIIADESELKNLLEISSLKNSKNISIKSKIIEIKSKYNTTLQYPFDIMYDYILSVFEYNEYHEEKIKFSCLMDGLHREKNGIFMQLKASQGEIHKNENVLRNLTKEIKNFHFTMERYNHIKTKQNEEMKEDLLREYLSNLKDFKFSVMNNHRKLDIHSLTLRSEYSESECEREKEPKEEEMMRIKSNNSIKFARTKTEDDKVLKSSENKWNSNSDIESNSKSFTILRKKSYSKAYKSDAFAFLTNSNKQIKPKNLNVISIQRNNVSPKQLSSSNKGVSKRSSRMKSHNQNRNSSIKVEESKTVNEEIEVNNLIVDNCLSPNHTSAIENIEQIESLTEDTGTVTFNKIPVRPSKITTVHNRKKGMKSMGQFLNLKFEKPVSNSGGCCVSCT